jgi:hypothetical protein
MQTVKFVVFIGHILGVNQTCKIELLNALVPREDFLRALRSPVSVILDQRPIITFNLFTIHAINLSNAQPR